MTSKRLLAISHGHQWSSKQCWNEMPHLLGLGCGMAGFKRCPQQGHLSTNMAVEGVKELCKHINLKLVSLWSDQAVKKYTDVYILICIFTCTPVYIHIYIDVSSIYIYTHMWLVLHGPSSASPFFSLRLEAHVRPAAYTKQNTQDPKIMVHVESKYRI